MKKLKETKIIRSNRSWITSIPNFLATYHGFEKGDKLEWNYNPDDLNEIRVRVIKKQP